MTMPVVSRSESDDALLTLRRRPMTRTHAVLRTIILLSTVADIPRGTETGGVDIDFHTGYELDYHHLE